MVSPWIAGLFGLMSVTITWVATRHHYQIRAYRRLVEDLHKQYGNIIQELRSEIDRLKAWILELESVRKVRSRGRSVAA